MFILTLQSMGITLAQEVVSPGKTGKSSRIKPLWKDTFKAVYLLIRTCSLRYYRQFQKGCFWF